MGHVYVLMRDEKEGRKKQARSNKQQGKATQYTCTLYNLKMCPSIKIHIHCTTLLGVASITESTEHTRTYMIYFVFVVVRYL